MNVWAISESQPWLAWAVRLTPDDAQPELTRAVCFRRLGEMERWSRTLRSAERKGASAARIEQESELGRVRSGELLGDVETRLVELAEAAQSPHDVAEAFAVGYVARGEFDKARTLLEGWEASYPNDAHMAYMWGVYHQRLEEPDRAIRGFEKALARQPRHEPARLAIAEVLEDQDRLHQAFEAYADVLRRFGGSDPGRLGLASVLRKLGRIDEARSVLLSLVSRPAPSPSVMLEMGQIALDSGDYEEAMRWFAKADVDRTADVSIISAAATTAALHGENDRAEQLITRYATLNGASTRMFDLQARLAIDPNDRQAARELQRLHATLVAATGRGGGSSTEPPEDVGPRSLSPSGPELFALHCSACHGTDGEGNGRAARHLFPRPRDLRAGGFRLVSTLDGVPTLDDSEQVIRLGMPGTSMPPYEDLSEDERKLLAQEMLRLRREGVREQYVKMLRDEGEEIDEDEVRQVVKDCTEPTAVVDVPPIGPPDAQAVRQGKEAYLKLGCGHCHGEDGAGARDVFLFDEKGRPTRARDLVHEPFKGGREPEAIYLRIAVGMPGGPHPSAGNLSQEQLIELVQYCRSLSAEPARVLTNHQQAIAATSRAYLAMFGASSPP